MSQCVCVGREREREREREEEEEEEEGRVEGKEKAFATLMHFLSNSGIKDYSHTCSLKVKMKRARLFGSYLISCTNASNSLPSTS